MTTERIAKRIARAGRASRRGAEAMLAEDRVRVNGRPVSDPATLVGPKDRVEVDGEALPPPPATRLWLHHKPAGLVTTERDEKGRRTVFDALPEELGRVLSVGRLDLTSEGLLLLTNDGALKRHLEHPDTGWMRRYRVRVHGEPTVAALDRLRAGVTVEGEDGPEDFAPMQADLQRSVGANHWLMVGLREGRNREVRRACEAVGLTVSRLIRVSYGPFQLGDLRPGAVEEVKPRILRDQLGSDWDEVLERTMAENRDGTNGPKGRGPRTGGAKGAAGGPRRSGPRDGPGDRPKAGGPRRDGKPAHAKGGPRKDGPRRDDRDGAPAAKGPRKEGFRKDGPRKDGPRKDGPRKDGPRRDGGRDDGPRAGGKPSGPGRPRPGGDRVARDGARSGEGFGARRDGPSKDRPRGDRPGGPKGARPERGDRPKADGPRGTGPRGDGPRKDGPRPDRPRKDGPRSDRPRKDGPGKDGPRTGKPPFTRNDRTEADKPSKAERRRAIREDTTMSLRTKRKGFATKRPPKRTPDSD